MILEILVDFALAAIVPAVLLFLLLILFLLLKFWNAPKRSQLIRCDYVIFEAEPINLPSIKADLAENGWLLVDSQGTSTDAMLYRFEKGSAGARCLSEIYNFDRSMPRTANRTIGNNSLIKIHAYGSRQESHVH